MKEVGKKSHPLGFYLHKCLENTNLTIMTESSWLPEYCGGVGGLGGRDYRSSQRRNLEVMDMFVILIVVMISLVYLYNQNVPIYTPQICTFYYMLIIIY